MEAKLSVLRTDGTRRVFPLNLGITTIGRKNDCDIRVPLETVSRRHAEIAVSEDGVTIKDLGAANGTYVNNQRMAEEEGLEPGDQIAIGPVVFTIQIDGEPSDEELAKVCSKVAAGKAGAGPNVATSQHVYTSDPETDPISALEALASSADQTAIDPEDD